MKTSKPRYYYSLLSISVLGLCIASLWWQHLESQAAIQQSDAPQTHLNPRGSN